MSEKPQDFVQVPREPTEEMLSVLHDRVRILCDPGDRSASIRNDRELYRAMIEAAPDATQSETDGFGPVRVVDPDEEIGRLREEAAAWGFALAAAPPAPGGWMTIETAPKDGRFVLLHVPQGLESGVVTIGAYWKAEERTESGRFQKGNWDGWLGMDADILSSWCEPTHWQPLPPAPGDEKGKGGENSASLTGPGSHASHEAPSDLRPAGVDPIAREVEPVVLDGVAPETVLEVARKSIDLAYRARGANGYASFPITTVDWLWQRARDTEDLREVIRDSLEQSRLSNEAMNKAINPNGEKRDFIPAARQLHARIKLLEMALRQADDLLDMDGWDVLHGETRALIQGLLASCDRSPEGVETVGLHPKDESAARRATPEPLPPAVEGQG